jgi:uncharacterized YccA/Bax inhibitor family protein
MFQTNPALSRGLTVSTVGPVTITGVVHRTAVLLLLTAISFMATWRGVETGMLPGYAPLAGALLGMAIGLYIAFKQSTNPYLISLYALSEGVILGYISCLAEARYPGVASEAVLCTMACFLVVLGLYRFRVLRATPGLAKGVMGCMLAIGLIYLVDIVGGFFGHSLSFIHGSSPVSIGFSLVVVAVATVSFVFNFAQVEKAVSDGTDEGTGWYLAFGLLVSLVWLYIEILRLLMKLRDRK